MITPTTDALNTQLVRIESTSTNSSTVTPVIAVGDILKFTVKSNGENGQGTISFRGNIISATVPQNLEVGSSVIAKVVQSNNQLIFQVVDQELQLLINNQSIISNQLQEIIKNAGLKSLISLTPLELPKLNTNNNINSTTAQTEVLKLLTELYGNIATSDQLVDSGNAQNQLLATTTGKNSDLLKDISQKLKLLLGNIATPEQQFIATLSSDLEKLINGFANEEIISKKTVDFILSTLKDHLTKNTKNSADEELLKSVFNNLQKFQDNQDSSSFKEIQSSFNQINNYLLSNNILNSQTAVNVEELTKRLDQIVNVQEQLNQLNPIMQFAGEPALLLFPFIAQGLLTHSEIRLEAEYKPKKKGEGEEENFSDSENSDNQLYRRIQVAVPLPSMGLVDVDIAYKENEILVKFVVEDPDVADFLKSEMEHLVKILRDNNYQKAEISTQIGKPSIDVIPDWLKGQRLVSEKA
ncbi:MAG: flagellar hook-length control protein FliK [Proteobacteria bacterium]|nr:flagellar hook-length control protein FliK [Pseudomonadota bacterium]